MLMNKKGSKLYETIGVDIMSQNENLLQQSSNTKHISIHHLDAPPKKLWLLVLGRVTYESMNKQTALTF